MTKPRKCKWKDGEKTPRQKNSEANEKRLRYRGGLSYPRGKRQR